MDPSPGPDLQLAAGEKVLPFPRYGEHLNGECGQVEARQGRLCHRLEQSN